MGKKDNKKNFKNGNVGEFSVDSALETEKKNLNSKRVAYAFYTAFCFILVFAAAAACGYFMANNVAALSQRRLLWQRKSSPWNLLILWNAILWNWKIV